MRLLNKVRRLVTPIYDIRLGSAFTLLIPFDRYPLYAFRNLAHSRN